MSFLDAPTFGLLYLLMQDASFISTSSLSSKIIPAAEKGRSEHSFGFLANHCEEEP